MIQTMFYIFPLLLGRTMDLNQLQVGIDIFQEDQFNSPRVTNFHSTSSIYKLIEYSGDTSDLLYGSSASFRLNAKSGLLRSGAVTSYLQDKVDQRTTVEVIIKATYMTIIKSMTRVTERFPSWEEMQGLGTHYVANIAYGGELIAAIRMKCNSTSNKQRLADDIRHSQVRGFGMEEDYVSSLANSVDSMEIKLFSSVPLKEIPKDMTSLKAMIGGGFVEAFNEYNNGTGVPVNVELRPLNELNFNRSEFNANIDLANRLDFFEEKFNDLLDTKLAIKDWMKSLTFSLSEEGERKIGELYGHILATLRLFYDIIGKLDLTEGPEQLSDIRELYKNRANRNFYRQYRNLRQEIENNI